MEKVTTPKGRLAFPNLFTARAFEGNDPKYSCVLIFDKKQDLARLKALAKKAADEKWPNRDKSLKLRSPFRDGTERSEYEGFENSVFITASTKKKPIVVDKKRDPIFDEEEVYAGCYCYASVNAYAYDKNGNKGVAFGLINIQKAGEGEAFGFRSNPEDDFEILEDDTEETLSSNENSMEL